MFSLNSFAVIVPGVPGLDDIVQVSALMIVNVLFALYCVFGKPFVLKRVPVVLIFPLFHILCLFHIFGLFHK